MGHQPYHRCDDTFFCPGWELHSAARLKHSAMSGCGSGEGVCTGGTAWRRFPDAPWNSKATGLVQQSLQQQSNNEGPGQGARRRLDSKDEDAEPRALHPADHNSDISVTSGTTIITRFPLKRRLLEDMSQQPLPNPLGRAPPATVAAGSAASVATELVWSPASTCSVGHISLITAATPTELGPGAVKPRSAKVEKLAESEWGPARTVRGPTRICESGHISAITAATPTERGPRVVKPRVLEQTEHASHGDEFNLQDHCIEEQIENPIKCKHYLWKNVPDPISFLKKEPFLYTAHNYCCVFTRNA